MYKKIKNRHLLIPPSALGTIWFLVSTSTGRTLYAAQTCLGTSKTSMGHHHDCTYSIKHVKQAHT